MSMPERLIKLDDAEVGQTLARALQDARGQVLMAAGAQVTEAAMVSLRRRDIEEIWIVDHSAPLLDPSLEDAARRERHRQRLARLFRHAQGQPGAQRLLALVRQYRGVETP
jgi:t-SNARE complex subunit (syntaxin)